MAHHLLILISLFIWMSCVHSQSYCIWGKNGPSNSRINGEYDYDGDYEGVPSYRKTLDASCGSNAIYLYRNSADTTWRISTSKGSTTANVNAQCSNADLSQCTVGNWNSNSAAVFAQSGACPEWECTEITTGHIYQGCQGPFTQDVGHNAWSNAAGDLYFYFSPTSFSWICYTDLSNDDTCSFTAYSFVETGWDDISPGQSVTKEFSWGDPTNTADYAINCIGTKAPTLPEPTVSPVAPIPSPTSSPEILPQVPSGTDGEYCIWGRVDANNFNTVLNGQYIYDGEVNNKPSYKKITEDTCDPPNPTTLYLYWSGSQWRVGTTSGSGSFYSGCPNSDLSQCTAGTWQVVQCQNCGFSTEVNMFAQAGACPHWNCQSVNSDFGNTNCRSFTTQLGSNAWSNSAGYVWYFNPTYFTWLCINGNTYPNYDCGTSYITNAIAQGWTDLASGANTVLSYETPAGSGQVSCVGTGTNRPTAATPAPTSATADPSTTPTSDPTQTPSQNPSVSPTNRPSDSPIIPGTPTKAPSRPTPLPTGSPTPSPTFKPTVPGDTPHPTTPPTMKPTTNPIPSGVQCVRISGMDNTALNGEWNAIGSNLGQIAYSMGAYFLYYKYYAFDDKSYWTISNNLGSDSWSNGWCFNDDILECDQEWVNENTNARFSSVCGVLTPTVNPNMIATESGDNSAQSTGTMVNGLSNGVVWVIIVLMIVFCCCAVLICAYALLRNRKLGSQHTGTKKRKVSQQKEAVPDDADDWGTGVYGDEQM